MKKVKSNLASILAIAAVFFVVAPLYAASKQNLSVSAWIPYWEKTAGTTQLIENLQSFNSVSPFSFEVQPSGILMDKLKLDQTPWPETFSTLKQKSIKIYPTVAWHNGDDIHKVLSSKSLRTSHIASIKSNILDNSNFSGVDIDYENKLAETKDNFSLFLKELSVETKKSNKKLICTIEARTPVDSRYTTVTKETLAKIQYANDYKKIGQYCDEVRIMAYDQGTVDVKLNAKYNTGIYPYIPNSDSVWVEKVIALTLKDIPASKVVLGLPTYGYKYEIVAKKNGGYKYTKLRSMSYNTSIELAKNTGSAIRRSASGELFFMYNAVGVESYAGVAGTPLHAVVFSDSVSTYDKIKLAKKYKLAGIIMFKLDGDIDTNIFNAINTINK